MARKHVFHILVVFLVTGCCGMPFVDCGPVIKELKPVAENYSDHSGTTNGINVKAWVIIPRYKASNPIVNVKVDIKTNSKSAPVLPDDCCFLVLSGVKISPNEDKAIKHSKDSTSIVIDLFFNPGSRIMAERQLTFTASNLEVGKMNVNIQTQFENPNLKP